MSEQIRAAVVRMIAVLVTGVAGSNCRIRPHYTEPHTLASARAEIVGEWSCLAFGEQGTLGGEATAPATQWWHKIVFSADSTFLQYEARAASDQSWELISNRIGRDDLQQRWEIIERRFEESRETYFVIEFEGTAFTESYFGPDGISLREWRGGAYRGEVPVCVLTKGDHSPYSE